MKPMLALLALAAATALAAAAPPSRKLVVINDSEVRLQEFYIARLDQDSEDVLGPDVVEPGARVTLDLADDACLYELRANFADGRSSQRNRYDACAGPELHLGDLLEEDARAAPAAASASPPPPPPPPPAPAASWDGAQGSSILAEPAASAPAPERGVPICPGDVRCKKKPGG